ncbi:nitric oxide reductase transcriptional regulator NorR [Pseudomonas citronellolis]|uniref:nitric oxide reductase transcriptional regulator NorR n=1 Tax=Pseudomonas citronellolis TaxID=53408 RepID=UPI00085351A2|nr:MULTISPECIES: nitric oxide reductase transcriptional regulator NorR [Pseudomonas]WRT86023.1 nitric oxide reductase transcriptional regulator NorR [Pseudomonas citronellolis]
MTSPGTGSNDLKEVKNTSLLDRLLADLADDLPTAERLQRLVVALRDEFACSAVVLLQLDGDSLQPQAAVGLDREVLGRRFAVASHPRLAHILAQREPLQFSADSELPDPYDGLLQDSPDKPLPVHDCMGMSLYLEGRAWGALTLDALRPGSFSPALVRRLEHYAPLIEAAVRVGRLESEVRRLRLTRSVLAEPALEPGAGILGESPVLHQLLDELKIVADSELPVLLQGETGVGKELFARALHASSPRSRKPLVYVNCAALPETLAESELFGHVRGAFSGAAQDRQGRFEAANGGTLFLDEIGELPLSIQAKLLRALQGGEIQRLGADRPKHVDVRIIAATNRHLADEVRGGRFRADLYHRLSVYPVHIPPLRERGQDVLVLAGHFLELNRTRLGLRCLRLTPDAEQALLDYAWPGNVRELEHLISRAALKTLSQAASRRELLSIDAAGLGLELPAAEDAVEIPAPSAEDARSLQEVVDDYQRRLLQRALQRHGGKWAAAARALKMDPSNLRKLARRLDLR